MHFLWWEQLMSKDVTFSEWAWEVMIQAMWHSAKSRKQFQNMENEQERHKYGISKTACKTFWAKVLLPIFTNPLNVGVCIPVVKVTQLCPTLCNPLDYTVQGILQARILEWVAFRCSKESSQPRDRNQVSGIAGRFFTSWATSEACIPVRGPIMG